MCPTLRYAKVDCVRRVTTKPVFEVAVIDVEIRLYGVVCVVDVKKIERSRGVIEKDTIGGVRWGSPLYEVRNN